MGQMESLRAFEAAAAAGSFAGGGRALGLTRDQIAKLVAGLEHRVGTRLFDRTTRAVVLTDVGSSYLGRVRRALADLDAAEAAARAAEAHPSGLLTVHAPLSWGVTVLSPLCGPFRKRFPDVHVELTLDDRRQDPVPDNVDVVLRIAAGFDGNAAVQRLGDVGRGVYAAPAYLARFPALATPEDLSDHDCIRYAPLATGEHWVLESGAEVRRVHVRGGFASNAGIAVLASIVAGAGIGILPDFLARDPASRGEIQAVLPEWRLPLLHIHAITRPTMRHAPKVSAYLEFLNEMLSATLLGEDDG